MSNRADIERAMPALLKHEGVWTGTYRFVNLAGEVIDTHASRVECEFPYSGRYHYVQRNTFTWPDGRVRQVEFGGELRDERIWWDTDSFAGYGWVTGDDIVLLELQRKDVADASFTEVIVLGANPDSRGRTWHWFRGGELYQRTLCDERRLRRS